MNPSTQPSIVFRADDAGSSVGANRAIAETVRNGVVRNVSVMAPGPAFEDAVPMLTSLEGVDFGLHVTLSSEWASPKWGPLTNAPSLVEPDGSFTQNPGVLQSRGFSLEEAMAEVAAQLHRLRDAGIFVAYLDEHMGVGWIEGLGPRLRDFCRQEGLLYAGDISYLAEVDVSDPERLLATLRAGETGVLVFHPGSDDDPVMASFWHEGLQPGQIHAERMRDRRVLTSPLLREAVTSLTYTEAFHR